MYYIASQRITTALFVLPSLCKHAIAQLSTHAPLYTRDTDISMGSTSTVLRGQYVWGHLDWNIRWLHVGTLTFQRRAVNPLKMVERLYGLSIAQFYTYFGQYKDDTVLMKVTVRPLV